MARAYVGEFSLTPSPQSNELYAERARNTEFFYFLHSPFLTLSSSLVHPCAASFHRRHIRSKTQRRACTSSVPSLSLALRFCFSSSPYGVAFSQFLRNWSVSRARTPRLESSIVRETRHATLCNVQSFPPFSPLEQWGPLSTDSIFCLLFSRIAPSTRVYREFQRRNDLLTR